MNKDTVEQYLERYKANIGRCGYLKVRMRRAEEELEAMRQEEANPLRASVVDGLPRGTALSDPTAKTAARIADGDWPERIASLERERDRMARERARVLAAIDYVDAWLSALPEREEWLLRTKIIDGVTWETVRHLYTRRYGMDYSMSGLKHIRAMAIKKICAMAA